MPLHNLMHAFRIQPQKIETIKVARQSTKWKPHIKIQIAKDKNNMIKEMHEDNSDVKVFMDRSGMKGKIGAATVLYGQGRLKSQIQYKLGVQSQHMVYEGEGISTVLGAKLISNEWGIRSATFCIDSQAAIKAIQLTKPKPGHYIFDMLHKSLEGVRNQHPGIRITVRLTPGHEGIEGNKRVDEEAKREITEGSSN